MGFSLDEIAGDLGGGGKGKKFNKGMFLLIGVIVIVVFVLFRKKPAPPLEAETIPDVQLAGYPSMSEADINSTFANYSSVMMGQVGDTLEGFQNDIMDTLTLNQTQSQKYMDDIKNGLEKQMGTDPQTVEKKNSAAWTIGYGVSGEGNPNAGIDFSKDRTKLKEEVDRTLSVIAYRERQGLDNSAQERHLNNIRKL